MSKAGSQIVWTKRMMELRITHESAWVHRDGSETYVVVGANDSEDDDVDSKTWINVIRFPANGQAANDRMFIPYFVGLVENGTLTRVS